MIIRLRVYCYRFSVSVSRFRVWGLGFQAAGLGLAVVGFRGLGFLAPGSSGVQGSEFRASGLEVSGLGLGGRGGVSFGDIIRASILPYTILGGPYHICGKIPPEPSSND